MTTMDGFGAHRIVPGVDRKWKREDAVYPRGICSVCDVERRVKNDGTIGSHRRILNQHYRGQHCSGSDELPKRITFDGKPDEGRGDELQQPDARPAGAPGGP